MKKTHYYRETSKMMDPPIYEWKIYCETEGAFISYYGPSAPVSCPNNTAHTVGSTSQTKPVNPINQKEVIVTDPTPNRAFYQATTIEMYIPPSTQHQTLTKSISFPFDMYIWEINLSQQSFCIGDKLSVQIAPDTVLGVLKSDVKVGDNVINCSPTVTDRIARGCEIGLSDGVNKEYLGIVTSFTNSQITTSIAPMNNYAAGSNILWSLYIIKDLVIDSCQRIIIGSKGLKTKLVNAGTPIVFHYYDNTIYPQGSMTYLHIQYYRL